MTKRERNVARALELRAQGLTYREIGERMGVSPKTAQTWVLDPDLSKQRARRIRYARPCQSCGELTSGGGGYKRHDARCRSCVEWPTEAILDAIRQWADAHDGTPPRDAEWRQAGDDHPSSGTVERRLGWNEAAVAAGFMPRCDRRPETWERIQEQVRAGVRVEEIADRLGVGPAAIYMRFSYRGLSVREARVAA